MLRPGFSLVGLSGIVFFTAPNAPAGCLTVAIDWPRHGYTAANGYEEGSLPLFVNIPAQELVPLAAPPVTPHSSPPSTSQAEEPNNPSDKPGLRLV